MLENKRADDRGDDRRPVPAAAVAIFAVLLVERGHVHAPFGDQIIIDHHHAEDRPHRRADRADEGRRAALPGREGIEHERDQRRDIAAFFEVDITRKHVGEVEGRRDEIGHDIDAQRRHRESQRGEQSEEPAIEFGRYLVGMQQHFAIDLIGGDGGDAGDQREQDQIDRQAPDIAGSDRLGVRRVAREVAEIEIERGEIGDPGRRHRHQRGE